MVTLAGKLPTTTAEVMERDEIERSLELLHPECFGWALACCHRNRTEAEDVLQTSYVKVLEGTARFSRRSCFRTWLFGVIRRTALERRRRFAVRERLLRWRFFKRPRPAVVEPTDVVERSARSKRLLEALNELSQRQREVLELVFYHEMTIEDAAKAMGVSLGSARTHYHRGKKNLRGQLGEQKR